MLLSGCFLRVSFISQTTMKTLWVQGLQLIFVLIPPNKFWWAPCHCKIKSIKTFMIRGPCLPLQTFLYSSLSHPRHPNHSSSAFSLHKIPLPPLSNGSTLIICQDQLSSSFFLKYSKFSPSIHALFCKPLPGSYFYYTIYYTVLKSCLSECELNEKVMCLYPSTQFSACYGVNAE